MRPYLFATIAVAVLALCACGTAAPAAPPNAVASTQIAIGNGLVTTTRSVDLAVNAAEVAHEAGILTGDNWTRVQLLAQQARALLDNASDDYMSADFDSVTADLNTVATVVGQIKALTPLPVDGRASVVVTPGAK